MPIRVLHVIDHLGYGGAPMVVKGLVERMPADRVESLICTLRPNPKPLPLPGEVVTLPYGKYNPATVRALAHLCRSRRIDIVHAHLQKAVISSLLAKPRCASRLVIHEHGPIFVTGFGRLYRAFLWLLGQRADAIIANSEAARAAVQRASRRPDVSIAVVANFINLDQFDPDRYDRNSAREALGLEADTFAVGFVGRLDRDKGADLLVAAAALLRDRYRFYIVGDGPERASLEARIRALDLDRTVVLTGLCENTATVMRAFDAGVVPSRQEAFGIAALELMRMKVPVIVSPVGGLPELVRDGQTGLVLPRPAPPEVAAAIRTLREDPVLGARLGQAAFEYSSSFGGQEQIRQIVEIYERLMSGKERSR